MRDSRFRTSISTEFRVSGERATGKIKNVSESGVFVGTDAIPEQGQNVDLNFRAPGGAELQLSGLVWWTTADSGVRHRGSGFGLRLLDEDEDFHAFWSSLR